MKKQTDKLIQMEKEVMLGTYARPEFIASRGDGVYLIDTEGRGYLDFVSGIAVNAFGYGDAGLISALKDQADKLWHCSNLYYSKPQIRLARLLVRHTFADKVFFANSGAEAMEGAMKIVRKYGHEKKGKHAFRIIAMARSFHGRTFGALSATGQGALKDGFEPMLPGIDFAEFNHLESIKNNITPDTAAIIVEPVQGEGGIYPATETFMKGLRTLCNENDILLVLDEIQCGLGRTGTFSAHEQYGITPDIMALAKPLAGGLPLSAILTTDAVADVMGPGSHGSTFGGGPLVCAVASAVIERLADEQFLQAVREKGVYLASRLEKINAAHASVTNIRGMGLMVGIGLDRDPKKLIAACLEKGLLICKTGENAVRLLPPLIIENTHVDEAVEKLDQALDDFEAAKNPADK